MRLTSIRISNYLGIREADITLRGRALLVAGPNGAGKSSLRDALRLALCADAVRVALKKDYGALVRDGAKQASIRIGVHDDDLPAEIAVTVAAAGKVSDSLAGRSDLGVLALLPHVLDGQRLSAMPADDRRTLLYSVAGVSLSPAQIKARLLKRGHDEARVDEIAPVLRVGLAEAEKRAATRATEAKGAWKAATGGEAWGAKKAATWTPPAQPWTTEQAEELHALAKEIAALKAERDTTNQRHGAAVAEQRRYDAYAEKLAGLRETAKTFAAHEALVNRATDQLAAVQADLDAARAAAGKPPARQPQTCACPACGVALVREADGTLVEYAAPAPVPYDPEQAARIPDLERAAHTAQTVLDRHIANRDAANRAATEIKVMEDNLPNPPTEQADIIAQTIATLDQSIAQREARRGELQRAHDAWERADQQRKDARRHHADVVAWQEIAASLAPDGIPAELAEESLRPINERLAQSAADAAWQPVTLDEGMAIRYGGRDYALCSESEQWRADAMIAEAIAHVSGVRLLVLDRLDVLDLAGRSDALGWVSVLAENSEIDTAIVLGTLKAVPKGLPETIQGVWIEGGKVAGATTQPAVEKQAETEAV